MSFECLDCKAIDGGYCEDCATENDELRELAEEWEEYGKALMDQVDSKEEPAHQFAVAHLDHAEALQELLEE